MKILIFSITYFPYVGGAEVAVKEITDRVGRAGVFEFDLITAKLDKKLPNYEKIGNVNVYRVGHGWILDKYFYPFLAYRKAKKLHKKQNYSIVNAIMANYAGIAALFFKWKYPNVKYLLNMQSGDSDFFMWLRTWFWYPIYKMVYTKADFIQPISNWLAQRAKKYGYKGEMKVVPNGVDGGRFKILDFRLKIADLKKQLGINEDEKVIITVSRLVEKNGIEDLIRAMRMLKQTPPIPPLSRGGGERVK
ncbi:glycosyltransferase [Patescibacteria group bacterium]